MARNLIEQVMQLEAEADRIVADARRQADELERASAEEVAVLRTEREDAFRQETEAFRAEQDERATREQEALDRKARQIAEHLRSPAPEAAARAVELILANLREA